MTKASFSIGYKIFPACGNEKVLFKIKVTVYCIHYILNQWTKL